MLDLSDKEFITSSQTRMDSRLVDMSVFNVLHGESKKKAALVCLVANNATRRDQSLASLRGGKAVGASNINVFFFFFNFDDIFPTHTFYSLFCSFPFPG